MHDNYSFIKTKGTTNSIFRSLADKDAIIIGVGIPNKNTIVSQIINFFTEQIKFKVMTLQFSYFKINKCNLWKCVL